MGVALGNQLKWGRPLLRSASQSSSTAPPLHKVTHSQHAKRTSLSPQAVNVSAIAMLFLPELVPRNVQQQTPDADEELLLIQQEAQLKLEVAHVWLS